MGLDIIGIENPVMDFNTLMEKMPERGGFAQLKDYSWQGGGNVGSALVAAARLGAKCGIVGLVGEDYFGQFCIDDFKRHDPPEVQGTRPSVPQPIQSYRRPRR